MQDAVPLLVELGLSQDRFPGVAHDVVAGTILVPDHQPQHFNRGSSAEQRKDQRLDDAERASNRARVSPRFEVVRAGNMPLRLGGCFVDRVPERDRVRDLRHGRGEVEIGGGIEHRIAAQDDERLDRARLHRGDERGQRAHARKRRVLRLVVADRLAGVAEMRVQRADRGVDGRGLALSGHDQPLAAVRQKVLGKGVDPARVDTRDAGSRLARGWPRAEQGVQRAPRGTGRSAGSRDGADDPPSLPSASRPLQRRRAGSSRHRRLPHAFRPRSLARDGSSPGRSGAGRRRGRESPTARSSRSMRSRSRPVA